MDRNSSVNGSNQIDSNPGQFGDNPSQSTPEGSVKAVASEVAQNAKAVAGELAERARTLVEDQVASAKQMAADRIGGVADALRATGDQLRSQGTGGVGSYVDQAVDKLDQASSYLQTSTFEELIADVGAYARREPAMIFGGAFVLGLFAGRFLKSSATPRIAEPIESGDGGPSGAGGRSEPGDPLGESGSGDKSFVPGVV